MFSLKMSLRPITDEQLENTVVSSGRVGDDVERLRVLERVCALIDVEISANEAHYTAVGGLHVERQRVVSHL